MVKSVSAAKAPGIADSCVSDHALAQARIRLHRRLLKIVCGSAWEDEFYAAIDRGEMPYADHLGALENILRKARAYPPGGSNTLMRRCSVPECRRWTPPSCVGEGWICFECLPDDDWRDARMIRGLNPRIRRRCVSCEKKKHLADIRRQAVCLDCHYAGLPDTFAAQLPGGHQTQWAIRDADLSLHIESSGHTSRRRIFKKADDGAHGVFEQYRGEDGLLYEIQILPPEEQPVGEAVASA